MINGSEHAHHMFGYDVFKRVRCVRLVMDGDGNDRHIQWQMGGKPIGYDFDRKHLFIRYIIPFVTLAMSGEILPDRMHPL